MAALESAGGTARDRGQGTGQPAPSDGHFWENTARPRPSSRASLPGGQLGGAGPWEGG